MSSSSFPSPRRPVAPLLLNFIESFDDDADAVDVAVVFVKVAIEVPCNCINLILFLAAKSLISFSVCIREVEEQAVESSASRICSRTSLVRKGAAWVHDLLLL